MNLYYELMYCDIEQLEKAITEGKTLYAAPGLTLGKWIIASDREIVLARSQLSADANGEAAVVFRLVSPDEASDGDSFLFVQRIIESDLPHMPYLLRWALAGTHESAELMREANSRPTPLFALTVDATCRPVKRIEGC